VVVILPVAEYIRRTYTILTKYPALPVFTGKGEGKTSISCATAIRLAEQGKRAMLVSTYPASNVGQVFAQTIGNTIRPVTAVSGLSVLEIDLQEAAQQYRSRIVDPIKGLLPDDVVYSISEQLSGACTTEIAAFNEFTDLLKDASLLTLWYMCYSAQKNTANSKVCLICVKNNSVDFDTFER
jgi:arsenite-transporting ATPase